MLFYTATIIISFLIAVPIIILIYETDSLTNKENSDFSFDELVAATGSTSGQKYRVKPVNLDYAKSTNRRKQLTVTPVHEEKPEGSTEIVTLESLCKPFNREVSASTC